MKKIAVILIVLIIIVLCLFVYFQIPFNLDFVSNLLNGLLSNFLILIIAIFVIDNLTKNIEKRKLKDINRRKSDFVLININIFVFKILKFLKIPEENYATHEVLKKEDLTFDYIWENFKRITKEKDIDQILVESTFKEVDKKKYLFDLTELIKEGAKSLSDALKDIYPHPAPDIFLFIDELAGQSGVVTAMSLVADVHEEVNKIIPITAKKMDRETADALLKFMMLGVKKEGPLAIIFQKLSQLSERAKNNDLFIN